MHWGKLGVQYLARRHHKKSPRFRLVDKLFYFLRLSRLWLRVLRLMVFVLGSKSKTMAVESQLLFKKKNKQKNLSCADRKASQ